MRSKTLKPGQEALAWAAGVSVVAWFVPLLSLLLTPVTILNTYIHELSHAFASLLTGGRVAMIHIYADGSGVTLSQGGLFVLVVSAGYLGASALGAFVIGWAHTVPRARTVLGAMALVLAVSLLVWVRGDAVGVMIGLFWILVFGYLWQNATGMALLFAVQFFGIQQCLSSFESLWTLLNISLATNRESDAAMMANATFIPAAAWASVWIGASVFLMFVAIRAASRAH